MSIFLHNTLTKSDEVFEPMLEEAVSMYHCGPTVYQRAHIGNLRAYVFADILRRLFEYKGFRVNQVTNITDVGHLTDDADSGEDKLEKEAEKKKETVAEIVSRFTNYFMEDLKALNVRTEKTLFPRASEHIPEQLRLIRELEKEGHTYTTSDGVYFDTATFPHYGRLGGINVEELQAAARIEENKEKRNPTDFALWKFSPKDASRQQEWDSPWGTGFPGWHIECSAMSMKYLGKTFDIHTGGIDHIPVHHNNEIAQSEAANHQPLANYWLHVNFITIQNQKVSKSLGNTLSLDDLREMGVTPLSYRYWLLTSHYRSQANASTEALRGAHAAYSKLNTLTSELKKKSFISFFAKPDSEYLERFETFISNDLNTPQAIALIWELVKDNAISPQTKWKTVARMDEILGLDLGSYSEKKVPAEVQELVKKREVARSRKDWKESDELRFQIEHRGFEVLDTAEGTVVREK